METGSVIKRLLLAYLGVSLALTLILSVLVVRENPGPWGVGGIVELGLAMLWISLAINAILAFLLLVLWLPARSLFGNFFDGALGSYFLGGLVGLNFVWGLWNRLAMANSFASGKRRFMTWTSLVELACLLVVGVGLVVFSVGLRPNGTHKRVGGAGLLLALAAALFALGLGAREESFHRKVSHARIATVAADAAMAAKAGASEERSAGDTDDEGTDSEQGSVDSEAEVIQHPVTTASGQRVVTIGADGVDWSVLVPLMEAGHLPNFARLVNRGAVGYLDNGNQSYSPVIWTTMFTGLSGKLHGVFDFQKAILPRSGKGVPNPLLIAPTIDTFHGLKTMLGSRVLQKPGLWHMAWVGAQDRRVPTVWDVASQFEKRVAICDALANLPARPINGAIINLGRQKGAGTSAFHPPELRNRWRDERTPDPQFENSAWGRFNALATRFDDEVGFALDILEDYGTDFCFYYTYFIDSQCHSDWNFYSPDDYFLTDLPRDLNDEEWTAFLLEHAEERAIKAYSIVDAQLGRFLDRFDDAIFVLVSDHGWTFSGYEHFNSPDGVVIFSGPGVKAGMELKGVHIQDIAPTLLALLDAPISRQLPGRVVSEAFDFELDPPVVDSYRDVDLSFAPGARVEVSDDEEERLRGIGYVR